MAVRDGGVGTRVGRVPSVQPQPILAPLTPAAIFLVVTIDDGGEATVHDALPDLSGLVRAIGFRDPTKHLSVVTSIGSDAWDRLFGGPPLTKRPAELHPFIELKGPRHPAPATAGGPVIPHPSRVDGRVFRAGRPHPQVDGRRGHRGRRGARLHASSTIATCWALSTAPKTRTAQSLSAPPRSVTRIPTSPARATSTSRSTCTTCRRGIRCRSPSRNG